jgi:tripartite-type tricarboxylate transporter receptor subunit TctC
VARLFTASLGRRAQRTHRFAQSLGVQAQGGPGHSVRIEVALPAALVPANEYQSMHNTVLLPLIVHPCSQPGAPRFQRQPGSGQSIAAMSATMKTAFHCLSKLRSPVAWLLLVTSMIMQPALGQEPSFPARPIQVIITSTPGSTSDVVLRFLGDEVGRTLGQPVVVISKASEAGTVGAEFVRRAAADGHTLLLGGNTTMAANLFLVKNLSYDPLRDFAPITLVSINPLLLAVRSGLPINSVAELVSYAKERPGQMNYGVGNSGARVATQLLQSIARVKAQDVTYRGASQAMLEVASGSLDFIFTDPLVADPYIREGRVRPLAVTSSVRLPSKDDLPTMIEAGVPGYDYSSFTALYAPTGTPRAVIEKLNTAFVQALNAEKTRDFYRRMAMIARPTTPEELASFQKEQIALWGRLVSESGLQPQ